MGHVEVIDPAPGHLEQMVVVCVFTAAELPSLPGLVFGFQALPITSRLVRLICTGEPKPKPMATC